MLVQTLIQAQSRGKSSRDQARFKAKGCVPSHSDRRQAVPTNSALFLNTLRMPCSDDSTRVERISTKAQ
jgi:hypothetical protein